MDLFLMPHSRPLEQWPVLSFVVHVCERSVLTMFAHDVNDVE